MRISIDILFFLTNTNDYYIIINRLEGGKNKMELKSRIITLTEGERNIISNCIASTLENDCDNHISAIYINSYNDEGKKLVDIQFVDDNIYSTKRDTITVSNDRLLIRKVFVPRISFSYGMMHTREICNAIDLLNSQIIMDTADSYYSELAKLAQRFGYGDYSNGSLIEPPISVPTDTKVKKLK